MCCLRINEIKAVVKKNALMSKFEAQSKKFSKTRARFLEKLQRKDSKYEDKIRSMQGEVHEKQIVVAARDHRFAWIKECHALKAKQVALENEIANMQISQDASDYAAFKLQLLEMVKQKKQSRASSMMQIAQYEQQIKEMENEIAVLFAEATSEKVQTACATVDTIPDILQDEDANLRATFLTCLQLHEQAYQKSIQECEQKRSELREHFVLHEEEHDMYVKLYKQHLLHGSMTLSQFATKVKQEMDTIFAARDEVFFQNEQDILVHHQLYSQYELEGRKIRDLKIGYSSKRRNVLLQMQNALKASAILNRTEVEKTQHQAIRDENQIVKQAQIDSWKQHLATMNEMSRQQAMREQQEKLDLAVLKHDMWQIQRRAQKMQLSEYYREQAELQDQLNEQKRNETALRTKEKHAEQMYNVGRVEYRFAQQQHKLQQTANKKHVAQVKKQEQQERLEKLRSQVTETLNPEALTRNPQRAMAPTEHMKQQFEAPDTSTPFKPVHGYTNAELMKDMRMRIQTALCEAGLAQTAYAKQFLCAVFAPKQQPKTV